MYFIKPNQILVSICCAIVLTACANRQSINSYAITAEDYQAAAQMLEANVKDLVKNTEVKPNWFGGKSKFWYRRDGSNGHEYVVVNSKNGSKTSAFDHQALASALSQTLSKDVSTENLGLSGVVLSDDLKTLTAVSDSKDINCDLDKMFCKATDTVPAKKGFLVSPLGTFSASAQKDNLFLTNNKTGEERQLTTDGEAFYSYGKLPDTALITITKKKYGIELPPYLSEFSPDESYLIAALVDEREVSPSPFVEWVPTDGSLRPILHQVRTTFTGDKNIIKTKLYVFDTKSGKSIEIIKPANSGKAELDGMVLGWSKKYNQAFMFLRTIGNQKVSLVRIDLKTGQSTVVKKPSNVRFERPFLRSILARYLSERTAGRA